MVTDSTREYHWRSFAPYVILFKMEARTLPMPQMDEVEREIANLVDPDLSDTDISESDTKKRPLLQLYKAGVAKDASTRLKTIRKSINMILKTLSNATTKFGATSLLTMLSVWMLTRIDVASSFFSSRVISPATILCLTRLVHKPFDYTSRVDEVAIPHQPIAVHDKAWPYRKVNVHKSLTIEKLDRIIVAKYCPICVIVPRSRGKESSETWDICLKFNLAGGEKYYAFIDVSSAVKYSAMYGLLGSLELAQQQPGYLYLKKLLRGLPQGERWVYIYMSMHEVKSTVIDDSCQCVLMGGEDTKRFFGPMSGFFKLVVQRAVQEQEQEQAMLTPKGVQDKS
jgi:hypothetical protein